MDDKPSFSLPLPVTTTFDTTDWKGPIPTYIDEIFRVGLSMFRVDTIDGVTIHATKMYTNG